MTFVNPNLMFIGLAPLLDRLVIDGGPIDRSVIEAALPEGYYITELAEHPFVLTVAAPSLRRQYRIEATPRAITINAEAYHVQ
jgi:hypothetical protein